jgi:hypothetical protein
MFISSLERTDTDPDKQWMALEVKQSDEPRSAQNAGTNGNI